MKSNFKENTATALSKWSDLGEKAGKTEAWLNLEETLKEDLDRHGQFARDAGELVQLGQESWEQTDHFTMLYGQTMLDDARDPDTDELGEDGIERYQELKDQFWEGYVNGRASIGKDVYKAAQKLIDKKYGKNRTGYDRYDVVAKPKKSGKKKSRAKSGESSIGGVR